jgi:hypothetical protein
MTDLKFNEYYAHHRAKPQSWRSEKVIEMVQHFDKDDIFNQDNLEKLSLSFRDYILKKYPETEKSCIERYESDSDLRTRFNSVKEFLEYQIENNFEDLKREYDEIWSRFYRDLKAKVSFLQLFESYPFLEKYRYQLNEILKSIGNTKFKMKYKIKKMKRVPTYEGKKLTDKGELVDLYYVMPDFQHIFEVTVEKDNFTLNFNTPLGKMFLYNTMILDTDRMPVEALSLDKNAYFLYKHFILNKRAGKNKSKTITLKFADMKEKLDIRWGNDRGVHKIFEKALDNIVEAGLLDRFKYNGRRVSERYYDLKFDGIQKNISFEDLILET